jgi:UDP-N-acetylglucosamine acyltransferase
MVHQFCNIGVHSMAAGGSIVLKDIPAYVMASGQSAKPFGMNVEGLRRRGFSPDALAALRRAYKTVYRQGLALADALNELESNHSDVPEVRPFIDSLRGSDRGIIR